MKLCITPILFMFITTLSISQEKNIETKSVKIEDFISFVVSNYHKNNNTFKNTTFLIQVQEEGLAVEDKVVLRQGLKLLSKRSGEEDKISIVTYNGFNGIALDNISVMDLKKILYTINNIKSSVKEFHDIGIELGYNHANDNFDEGAVNTIVIIRNPNAKSLTSNDEMVGTTKLKRKGEGKVLITAISLLPELIAVIKN